MFKAIIIYTIQLNLTVQVSSQQRINSGRKTSLLSSRPKSTYDHTPTLHRQTTKTPVSRRSIRSMSAMPRINLNFDDQTSDEKINISSNRTSNDQPTTSKIQDETRENFEKLFSMLNAQQSEIEVSVYSLIYLLVD